jgi:hypothetical protein
MRAFIDGIIKRKEVNIIQPMPLTRACLQNNKAPKLLSFGDHNGKAKPRFIISRCAAQTTK